MGTVSATTHMKLKVGMSDLYDGTRSATALMQRIQDTLNTVYTYTVTNSVYKTGIEIMGDVVFPMMDRVKSDIAKLSAEAATAKELMEALKKESEG